MKLFVKKMLICKMIKLNYCKTASNMKTRSIWTPKRCKNCKKCLFSNKQKFKTI